MAMIGRTATVLIRTKNEEKHLPATLEAVQAQEPQPTAIIVIDSGSTDSTLEVAASYETRIIEIPPEEWSYPRSLNLGASNADSDILVSLSAHCVPVSKTWLESLLRHFDDPRVAGVWGPGHTPDRPIPLPAEPEWQMPGTYGPENRTWGLSNANAAIRRSLWMEFPFDERLPATEDKAWGREAMERGYCIVYEPSAGVWHVTHSPRNAYRRSKAVAEGFDLMFPSHHGKVPSPASRMLKAAFRRIGENMRNPSLRTLRTDLKRIPTLVAAVVGEKTAKYQCGETSPTSTEEPGDSSSDLKP
jgi:glycosyltransferase involved in cell wall biosynthesis